MSYYLSADDAALRAQPGTAGERSFAVDYDVIDNAYFAFWPPSLDGRGPHYDTAPLRAPVNLLGYPVAHLAVRLDRPDANVFVYLEEMKADGTVEVLSFGRLMVSHRAISEAPWNSFGLPWHSGRSSDVTPLPAGETGELTIAMQPLSHRVAADSRLRLLVTGADPRQRNLTEIRENPAPQITLVDGWKTGSRIDLPLALTSE